MKKRVLNMKRVFVGGKLRWIKFGRDSKPFVSGIVSGESVSKVDVLEKLNSAFHKWGNKTTSGSGVGFL